MENVKETRTGQYCHDCGGARDLRGIRFACREQPDGSQRTAPEKNSGKTPGIRFQDQLSGPEKAQDRDRQFLSESVFLPYDADERHIRLSART